MYHKNIFVHTLSNGNMQWTVNVSGPGPVYSETIYLREFTIFQPSLPGPFIPIIGNLYGWRITIFSTEDITTASPGIKFRKCFSYTTALNLVSSVIPQTIAYESLVCKGKSLVCFLTLESKKHYSNSVCSWQIWFFT